VVTWSKFLQVVNEWGELELSQVKIIYDMKNKIDYFKHFEQCNIGNTDSLTNKLSNLKHKL